MLLILTGDFPTGSRETSSCAVVCYAEVPRRCTGLLTYSQAACVGQADAGVLSQAEVRELDRRRACCTCRRAGPRTRSGPVCGNGGRSSSRISTARKLSISKTKWTVLDLSSCKSLEVWFM